MDIYFSSDKLMAIFNDESKLRRKYGQLTDKIQQRMAELRAANSLSEISQFPPARCHELKGSSKGKFAVNVSSNYRLIFEPSNDPIPVKEDGG
ncbi:MAG: type II toxin-antitoxin system RelE/ParE family toxin, partial [Candidatus Omnitrophica bacterium]|nr:type II toxin-antitoxin system RelE/ParE family toxin [Candidatus Omnitrophota bacterium]